MRSHNVHAFLVGERLCARMIAGGAEKSVRTVISRQVVVKRNSLLATSEILFPINISVTFVLQSHRIP